MDDRTAWLRPETNSLAVLALSAGPSDLDSGHAIRGFVGLPFEN
jgi:hypothetical protein